MEVLKSPHENALILNYNAQTVGFQSSVVGGVAIICIVHPNLSHGTGIIYMVGLWHIQHLYYVYNSYVVGGFSPFEKYYSSQIGWFPQVGLKIKNMWFQLWWLSKILGKPYSAIGSSIPI